MSDSLTLGVSPVNDQASRQRYNAAVNARASSRMLPTPPPSKTNSPFSHSRVPSWAFPEVLKNPDVPKRGSEFLPAPLTPPRDESPVVTGNPSYAVHAALTQSDVRCRRALPSPPHFDSPQVQYVQPQFAGHYENQPQTLTASLTPPPASPIYMQPPVTHQPRPHQAINHARLNARAAFGSVFAMLDDTPHLPPPTPTHVQYDLYPRSEQSGLSQRPQPQRPMSAIDPRVHALHLKSDFGPPIAKSRSAPPAPLVSSLSPVKEPDDDPRAVYLKARPGSRPAPPSESRIMAYPSGALRNRTPDEIEKLRRGSLVAFLKGQHPLVIEKDLETQIARERQERRRANESAS